MSDLLRMDYINSLPQPFLARFCGDQSWWPVHDFEVQTGLMRIDVCGLLQVKSFGEVMEIKDGDHNTHDPDTFYSDFSEPADMTEQKHTEPFGITVHGTNDKGQVLITLPEAEAPGSFLSELVAKLDAENAAIAKAEGR